MFHARASSRKILFLSVALLGLASLSLFIGPATFADSLAVSSSYIIFELRLPRVLTAALAGACLGLGGLAFQSLFRNPLASPYTLGIASGASLGASIAIAFGFSASFFGFSLITLFALFGSVLTTALIFSFSKTAYGRSNTVLLLCGVALSFFFSSAILFVQYFSDITDSFRLVRWMMGGVDTLSYATPVILSLALILLAGAMFSYRRELDLCSVDEELAVSRGVALKKVRVGIFLTTSLCIGLVVSFTGPIGFIGIIAPHIARSLVGASHSRLMPFTLLLGSSLLVICDCIARTAFSPAELPVGVITALLGGPFFLAVLFSLKTSLPFGNNLR